MIAGCPEAFYTRYRYFRNLGYWYSQPSLFIHIPKNGGWSQSMNLYGRFLGHIPASYILERGNKKLIKKDFFSYYRDPIERFMSAYNYMMNGSDNKKSSVNFRLKEKLVNLNPIECLRYIADLCDKRRDPIFRTQHFYCCDLSGDQKVALTPLTELRDSPELNKSIKTFQYNDYKNNKEFIELIRIIYSKDYKLLVDDIRN